MESTIHPSRLKCGKKQTKQKTSKYKIEPGARKLEKPGFIFFHSSAIFLIFLQLIALLPSISHINRKYHILRLVVKGLVR